MQAIENNSYEISEKTTILLKYNFLNFIFFSTNGTIIIDNDIFPIKKDYIYLVSRVNKIIFNSSSCCHLEVFSLNYSLIQDSSNLSYYINKLEPKKKLNILPVSLKEHLIIVKYIELIILEKKEKTTIIKPKTLVSLINCLLDHTFFVLIQNNENLRDYNNQLSKAETMNRIKNYIDQNYASDISLFSIAKVFYTNQSYISRSFKEYYQIGISNYISQLRINKAKQLLITSNQLITQIANDCGFNSVCTFNVTFKTYTFVSPSKYRKMHKLSI